MNCQDYNETNQKFFRSTFGQSERAALVEFKVSRDPPKDQVTGQDVESSVGYFGLGVQS